MLFPGRGLCYIRRLYISHMTGAGLMARPVTEEGSTGVNIYFPGGISAIWYDATTYKIYSGLSKVSTHPPSALPPLLSLCSSGRVAPPCDP